MTAFDPATLAFYAAEAPVYTASGKGGGYGGVQGPWVRVMTQR